MGVGDLLDVAFRGYRHFFPVCLGAYLLFCLPYVLAQAALGLFFRFAPDISATIQALTMLITILLAILAALLTGLTEALCASAVLAGGRGEPVTFRTALAGIRGRWGRLVGLIFLKGLLIGLGSLLCLVPGIIMSINYAVAVPVAVAEERYGSAALRRSKELVEEFKGKTFGLLFLLWLFGMVFTLAISAAVYGAVAAMAGGMLAVLLSASAGAGWGNVIVEAGTRLLLPLFGLLWGYYYLDLRARREGFDLTAAADRLAAAPGADLTRS